MKIYFKTPAMKIGKHEWRAIVSDHCFLKSEEGVPVRIVQYEWRKNKCDLWKESSRWPTYNHHDAYNGLPKSLTKLHEANIEGLNMALGMLVPVRSQGTLF